MKRLKTDTVELLGMAAGCCLMATLIVLPVAALALVLTLLITLI